jgi:hypothetical protein
LTDSILFTSDPTSFAGFDFTLVATETGAIPTAFASAFPSPRKNNPSAPVTQVAESKAPARLPRFRLTHENSGETRT